jgi:DNA helicase-2/ATP-dependent DNA helicase PcrA
MVDLSNLNDRQKEAVTTTEGEIMVMAGAGAGKTKVLTTRFAYISEELGISPYEILSVTFTNKAANEMKERISKMIDVDQDKLWVSTFHSFCVRVLRREISVLGYWNRYFQILDTDDVKSIISDICKEKNLRSSIKLLQNLVSKYKNTGSIDIKDTLLRNDFNSLYNAYQEKLKLSNCLDFDDLLNKTVELFKTHPEVLKIYQNLFQYIMIDEFQDTNKIQYELCLLLEGKHHNLFVVGDDFQSIYSFRGAEIKNIHQFTKDFKNYKLIKLEENYRSTTQILDLANSVIKHNPNQIQKTLYSHDKEGKKPIYYRALNAFDENRFIVDKIRSLRADGDKYSDIALLYRSNYLSREYEDLLVREHIPYRIYGGLSFYERKEVKDIISYIYLLCDDNYDLSFSRIVNVPKRGIGAKSLSDLKDLANDLSKPLFSAIDNFEGSARLKLLAFKDIINKMRKELSNIKLTEIIDLILKETNYIEDEIKVNAKNDEEIEDRVSNIYELKSSLAAHKVSSNNLDNIMDFIQDLSLMTSQDKEDTDSVLLSTYHQVKGLEFKNVFLTSFCDTIFPSQTAILENNIEEERRICYVGITRAKDNLFIISPMEKRIYGEIRSLSPSIFFKEMDKDLYYDVLKERKKNTTSYTNVKKNVVSTKPKVELNTNVDYKTGDKVNHEKFGVGTIMGIMGNTLVINFDSVGLKKLLLGHPSIKKI